MENRKNLTVTIVGPGRLGQAMGHLLSQAGVPIRFVAARQKTRAWSAVRFIGDGMPLSLSDRELADVNIVLMTTSDAALQPVVLKLAGYRENWTGKIVLHTCGSLPSSVLRPFKKHGASIGSLHPYQTIPSASAGVRSLPGGFWSVEGDRKAVVLARQWVRALSGRAFVLQPEDKPLYHLSAFLVCPTVVTLMDRSERLLQQAGVPKKWIRPMLGKFVSETVRNFAEFGGRKSLTGPVVRGDWQTLERHVAELQHFAPEVIPSYIELLNLMLRVAGTGRGREKTAAKAIAAGIRAGTRPRHTRRK